MKKNNHYLFIILFIAIGFAFRSFLASMAYDKIIYDAKGYSDYAQDFLEGRLAIDCCAKNVGYSLLLAIIYKLFGIENIFAVRLVHILIDIGTGGILYLTIQRILGRIVASISFAVYMLNPFTAAFTGLVLAETLTAFIVTVMTYTLTRPSFSQRPYLWLVLGFLSGALLFTRFSFYYFSFGFLVVFSICIFRSKQKRLKFFLLACVGFFVASSYSLYANYAVFQKVSVIPPYNQMYEAIYLNYYRFQYPEVEYKEFHPKYVEIMQGYWNTPNEQKPAYSNRFKELFFARLPSDWPLLVTNVAWNILWLWDKDHIYTYADPFYPLDRLILRVLNILLITSFMVGIITHWHREKSRVWREPFFLFSVLLLLYITFFFSLGSSESRHTISFYPLLTGWASYGAYTLWISLKHSI